jgi:lipopolysaccharide export system permease protein
MILPGTLAASVLTIGLIYYNSHVLPESNHALLNLVIAINRKQPTVELKANQRIDAIKGHTIYFREKNDRTGEIKDVQLVMHASKGGSPKTINAESGHLSFIPEDFVLRFDLVNGEIHELPVREDFTTYRRTKFKALTKYIKDIDRSLQRTDRQHRGDREMSVKMMREKIDGIRADIGLTEAKMVESAHSRLNAAFDLLDPDQRALRFARAKDDTTAAAIQRVSPSEKRSFSVRRAGDKTKATAAPSSKNEFVARQEIETQIHTKESYIRQIDRYKVEIQKKFSIPFACIIFVLIGSPIAIRTGKSGMNTAIGLSIFFFVVYYICLIGGEKLADRGIVGPTITMWSPNVIFGVIALLLLRNAAKERSMTEWNLSSVIKPFRRNAATSTR